MTTLSTVLNYVKMIVSSILRLLRRFATIRSFIKCRTTKHKLLIKKIESSPSNQKFAKEFVHVISKRQEFKKSAVKAYILGKAIKRNSIITEITPSSAFVVVNYRKYVLSLKALDLFKKLFDNDIDILILSVICGMDEIQDCDLKELFLTILEGDTDITESYPLGLYLGGREMVLVNKLPDNSSRFLSEFGNLLQALGLLKEDKI